MTEPGGGGATARGRTSTGDRGSWWRWVSHRRLWTPHVPRAAPILIVAGCVLQVGGVAAQRATRDSTADASLQTVIDRLFEPLIRDDLISGSVLIATDRKIVLAKGYGLANRERGLPNRPNTEFRIGSVTKLFTALMVMQLAERGLVSLTDPVTRFIPGFPGGTQVTVEHLLAHTSGIPSYTFLPDYGSRRLQPHTLAELVEWIAAAPREFAPGTRFRYSNSNYVLLARLIELVSGDTYGDYLRQHVVGPAGMTATGVDTAGLLIENRAVGYSRPAFGPVAEAADVRIRPFGIGDGDLYSTVVDLYRWDKALDAGRLLSDPAIEQMWEPVIAAGDGSYSRGWVVTEPFGHRSVSHGGAIAGFMARFQKFPDDGILVVTCFNFETLLAQDVDERLAAIVLGQPFEPLFSQRTREAHLGAFTARQGKYNIEPGQDLVLSIHDGHLYARYTKEETNLPHDVTGLQYEAQVLAPDRAFVKETNTMLTFQVAEDGETPVLTAYEGLVMWRAQRYAKPVRGRGLP